MPIASKRRWTTFNPVLAHFAPRAGATNAKRAPLRGARPFEGREIRLGDIVSDGKSKAGREGSLEAPTRHPIAWQEQQFYDAAALDKELERVFEICHGCRRCFNLCNSFPTLFELIDESKTGELDAVDKKAYWQVIDHCYLCDMCYMTKCPYVPPHPWNVDFPHLMLRAKAVKARGGGLKWRDKILSSTDLVGNLAGIPVIAEAVNAVNRSPWAASSSTPTLGVHPEAPVPEYRSNTLRHQLAGERTEPSLRRLQRRRKRHVEPQQGGAVRELLRQSQRAADRARSRERFRAQRHRDCVGRARVLLRNAEARAGRSRCGCGFEGQERSAVARDDRARLRHRRADPLVRADVQAGAAADVPRR